MDVFKTVRVIPEAERPTERPIPPKPQSAMVDSGTEEDWNEYWLKRDAYYHGVELRKVKG